MPVLRPETNDSSISSFWFWIYTNICSEFNFEELSIIGIKKEQRKRTRWRKQA
jgi:hypothetical protein